MDQPFWCRPTQLLTVEKIKQVLSSHYQNTVYDPYGGAAGKQFRPIALNRNLELHILQLRNHVPAALAGIHWLAFGPNTFNAVVPFYANVNDTPVPYAQTNQDYDPLNMYWLTNTLAALGDHRYQAVAPLVEQFEETVGAQCRALQHQADATSHATGEWPAYLTTINEQMAHLSQREALKLLGKLVQDAFNHEHLAF